jgi:acyl carrier protein
MGLAHSEAEIRDFCLDYLRKNLDIPADEIVPEANFARLGLDSGNSIHFLVGLEEWLGRELDPEVIYQHPTVGDLARHLAAEAG